MLLGFLSGSIPCGYLMGKSRGIDIRTRGSGNIGATNVSRVLGRGPGIACFALDMLKGLTPTLGAGLVLGLAGRWSVPPESQWSWIAIALAPIAGHVFCPWLGFKGGKGVATGLGALLGLYPVMTLASLGALLVWLAAIACWRYVSLASILAGVSLPAWVALEFALAGRLGRLPHESVFAAATPFALLSLGLAAFVVYTHRANIGRLRLGTEPRIGGARPAAPVRTE